MWLALASVRDPANPRAGRCWKADRALGFHFQFRALFSKEIGFRITDRVPVRGFGRSVTEGYPPLDQYLMGLRAPAEVPPRFPVRIPVSDRECGPQIGVSFNGHRRDIRVEEFIDAEGRRTPDHTVSQRRFRFAFLLVTQAGVDPVGGGFGKGG